MTIRRFTDGRSHKGGIGMPAVTEHPQGEYVLYADYAKIVAGYELQEKLLIARLKRAEGKE